MRLFETVVENKLKSYKTSIDVIMPLRKTKKSAGYDFFIPYDFSLKPGESILIWSDVKVCMNDDEFLSLYIRSSVGIKNKVILENCVGIIDSDYYNNIKNDGNIGMSLKNIGTDIVNFKKGEGISQGIFMKYYISNNCNCNDVREGGIGSTNK